MRFPARPKGGSGAARERNGSAAKPGPYNVQAIDRAVAILEELFNNAQPLALPEIAARVGLHKSTAHRLLMVLESHRMVERIGHGGYFLGLRLFEFGSRAAARVNLGERARPVLERLSAEVGETAHLCLLDRGEVLYLEKVEPARNFRTPSSVGRRNPAYCTAVGKALLGALPWDEVVARLGARPLTAHTPNTITSLDKLQAELESVRARGYAVDNEEIELGLRCVGAVVRDATGAAVASISIAAPASRLTVSLIPKVAPAVIRACADLSAELGFRQRRPLAQRADRRTP